MNRYESDKSEENLNMLEQYLYQLRTTFPEAVVEYLFAIKW